MKILHVIPSVDLRSGGPARAVKSYANISKAFADVTIAATNEGFEDLRDHEVKEHLHMKNSVDLRLFDYLGTHSYKFSNSMRKWLNHHVRDYDIAHIHAAFSVMSSLAAHICRKNAVEYIFRPLGTLSNFSMGDGSSTLKKIYFNLLEKKTLEQARAIHVTSEAEGKSIEHKLGKKGSIVVIGIPEEATHITPKTKRSERLILGFLSRIHPKKNLELLFKAMANLQNPVHLLIAGTGERKYENSLMHLADRLDITDSIEWRGFISDREKPDFFDAVDFLILPSKHENFGIAVIEALSYGRPVIISNNVDTAAQVQSYRCGIITEPTDKGIFKALKDAYTMKENEYQKMSRSAVQLVEEQYSGKVIGDKLRSLYGI